MARRKNITGDAAGNFVRGALASGIVSALQDKRAGADLIKAALLGGAALSTAASAENLIFSEGSNVAKKKAVRNRKRAGGQVDTATLETLLRGNQPTGLAALTPNQQLIAGLVVGAAAAWVLTDEELRGKLLRAGMKLYANLAGGFEEIKEQMADIQAELAAERMAAD